MLEYPPPHVGTATVVDPYDPRTAGAGGMTVLWIVLDRVDSRRVPPTPPALIGVAATPATVEAVLCRRSTIPPLSLSVCESLIIEFRSSYKLFPLC